MPFFHTSSAIMHGVKALLLDQGIEPEIATRIGIVAGLHTAATFVDHHAQVALSQEKTLAATNYKLEADYEVVNQMTTDFDTLVNEMEDAIASVEKKSDYTHNNLDRNKIEEIFSQIDLTQARITKDQEEIKSLEKETDNLLNQLEYMVS